MTTESFKAHYFAVVEWFESHRSKNHFGSPIELWCYDMYESLGPATFLPVQRIKIKFVAGKEYINSESLLVVMPMQQNVFA